MEYTYISEVDAEEQYDNELDELYPVEIAGMSFCASRILKELDPTAYNCGLADWLDGNELTTELISYRIELVEPDAEPDDIGDYPTIFFECEAENSDHAEEQARDAYPNCNILDIEGA